MSESRVHVAGDVPARPGGVRRWGRLRGRWQIPLFMLGLTLVGVALVIAPLRRAHRAVLNDQLVSRVRREVEKGRTVQALDLSELAVREARRTGRMLAVALFARGIALHGHAAAAPPAEQLDRYGIAARQISDAIDRLLPAEHLPLARYLLGVCLLHRAEPARAVPLLEEAVRTLPNEQAHALRALAEAYQKSFPPSLEAACQTYTRLLLHPQARQTDQIESSAQRTQLLKALGRTDWLAGLPADPSGLSLTWLVQLVQAEEHLRGGEPQAAVEIYRRLQQDPESPLAIQRRAAYLVGVAWRASDATEPALEAFQQAAWKHPQTEESVAALTERGQMLLDAGRPAEAAAEWDRAAQELATLSSNRAFGPDCDSLCRLLRGAIDQLRHAGQAPVALGLVKVLGRLLPAPEATVLAAEITAEWGGRELAAVGALPPGESEPARARAFATIRQAATLWREVGRQQPSVVLQAEAFWHAAQQLATCEDFDAASDVTHTLLSMEGVARPPQMLSRAAEWNRRCRRYVRAEQLARECLAQQPKGRHAALARLQLGICLAVRGDAEEAEQVLRANCVAPAGDDPTAIIPQSQLALAMLLRDIGRDAEALAQLDELLSRGADRDVTLEARYLRSECLRRRARRPAARADEAKTEEARAHFRKQQEADVQQAFEQFQQLQRELAVHERSHTATPLELRVLHNTRRALADCLYDLHRYEDALALLDKLAEVYPNPSDWLETQVQIANCYWRLEQPEQYRQVLRAARGRLEAMPVPAREEVRVGMSHARWQEWLDWVKRL